MKISIAMASYNGEKYLQAQLDSLTRQTRLPHELVITDDGSRDRTIEIAEAFAHSAPFPVHIYRNQKNLGYGNNFLKAASLCSGDWIAFCDQDDIWLDDKLAVVSMAAAQANCVMVVHSAELVDQDLKLSGKLRPEIKHDSLIEPLDNKLWWTPAGFACVFNASLVKAVPWKIRPHDFNFPQDMMAHDKWIYLLANALGHISYVAQPLALYRRHNETVTGSYDQHGLKPMLRGAMKANADHYNFLGNIAEEYRNLFVNLLSNEIPKWNKHQLRNAAAYYSRLSRWHHKRAKLYASSSLPSAVRHFLSLVISSAYTGSTSRGLGYRALAKDIVWCASRLGPKTIRPRFHS